jgi:cation diffusion facilitator family transporter
MWPAGQGRSAALRYMYSCARPMSQPAKSVAEDQATANKGPAPSKKPFIAAFIANCLVAAAKFIAAAITGSSAMIAEGVHSSVDAANSVLMLLGIRLSRRKPDAIHPFGHGKELYFWALIVAIIVFGLGGGISIYEGILHLLNPTELVDPFWNYGVLAVSFTADGWSWIVAYREFKVHQGSRSVWRSIHTSKDPTKFAVLLEDSAAILGVVVAGLGVGLTQLTGNKLYDGSASVIIGLLLCAIATILAAESGNLLIGESASPDTLAAIRKTVEADPDVVSLRNLLTMHMGPSELLLNLDVEFNRRLDLPQTARVIGRLESSIRGRHPEVLRIFIEAHAFCDQPIVGTG